MLTPSAASIARFFGFLLIAALVPPAVLLISQLRSLSWHFLGRRKRFFLRNWGLWLVFRHQFHELSLLCLRDPCSFLASQLDFAAVVDLFDEGSRPCLVGVAVVLHLVTLLVVQRLQDGLLSRRFFNANIRERLDCRCGQLDRLGILATGLLHFSWLGGRLRHRSWFPDRCSSLPVTPSGLFPGGMLCLLPVSVPALVS